MLHRDEIIVAPGTANLLGRKPPKTDGDVVKLQLNLWLSRFRFPG